ncbi:MAG: DNA polymerase I [Oscillospiraceae bacterium]|jgi:DNA polymerase-1|nr:DNA polymerase I [Oscillospiraceae bacterium]
MRLMALDGNSIINRAYYGVRDLTASDGTHTNAVYGFIHILQKLLREDKPDALCVAFDLPAPTFRHERFDEYKAQRAGMPDELAEQMPIMKSVLDAMRIPRYELSGWEADDIIGAIAKRCESAGWDCVIVTGDRDSFQLISGHTTVKHVRSRMGKTETTDYNVSVFIDEYGFEPVKIIDFKALMGDSSDNIPGVAGIGEKTAMELMRRFGGLSDVYGNLDSPDIKEHVRKKLDAGRDSAFMSYDLATIRCDAPINFVPEGCILREPDNDALYGIFQRLEFFTLTEKLGLSAPDDLPWDSGKAARRAFSAVAVSSEADASIMLARLRASPCASVYVSQALDSVAVTDGSEDVFVISSDTTPRYERLLGEIFGSGVKKAGHNVKDIMRRLRARGVETDGWLFDTALAAYLLAPTQSAYELGRLTAVYCGYTAREPDALDEDADGGQIDMFGGDAGVEAEDDKKKPGAFAWAAAAVRDLYAVLPKTLADEKLDGVHRDIDLPLCSVLADMELAGFMVDRDALSAYGESLAGEMGRVAEQIYSEAGERFNLNSPKQLGEVLFDKLKLPAPKKKKTGYSTSAEVLDALAGKHPIVGLVGSYRLLSKLKATYTDALIRDADAHGRVHTSFQMTVTATGRLSSVKPNLQNIPVRTEQGSQLRRMFVAQDGSMLVDADYSQIELRLLAHIAGDGRMAEAFRRGGDIHAETASQIFGVPSESVTPLQRRRAKAVNFGIVYGISAFSLAGDIGVTVQEAQSYIDGYLENFSGVRAYMKDIVERAKKDGYVTTLFGRKRELPELRSSNHNIRLFGERAALNTPIQGTAADIIKLAMINVSRRMADAGLKSRLVLQIHDELIAECPTGELDAVKPLLREEMENVTGLSVPLVAETRAGKSWYDAK